MMTWFSPVELPDSMSWSHRIFQAIQNRQQQSLWRHRACLESAQGVKIQVEGHSLINFCSNDYLGLANEGGQNLARAAHKWGLGSGASHLVCGHSQAHHELEKALAEHTGYPKALLFSTGYMANIGVISALTQRGDIIFQDKLNHASLLDGAMLSHAEMKRYKHCDYQHLENLLTLTEIHGERLIVSDSIFSMDGDMADVALLSQIAQKYNALLMLDDAHGFGVIGEQGRGCLNHFKVSNEDIPVYIGTLGKGLGGYGAFVAGSEQLIEYLIQFSRSYIYTTAMPPAIAEAMQGQLERLKNNERREHLNKLIKQFRSLANAASLPIMDSLTPIQPLLVGNSQLAVDISNQLKEEGFWVSAIRPPTVPKEQARLRITLTAAHTEKQISQLIQALSSAWQTYSKNTHSSQYGKSK